MAQFWLVSVYQVSKDEIFDGLEMRSEWWSGGSFLAFPGACMKTTQQAFEPPGELPEQGNFSALLP